MGLTPLEITNIQQQARYSLLNAWPVPLEGPIGQTPFCRDGLPETRVLTPGPIRSSKQLAGQQAEPGTTVRMTYCPAGACWKSGHRPGHWKKRLPAPSATESDGRARNQKRFLRESRESRSRESQDAEHVLETSSHTPQLTPNSTPRVLRIS